MVDAENNRDSCRGGREIAVVGAGHWGKNLIRNFHELDALVSACEIDQEKRQWLQQQYPDCELYDSFTDLLRASYVKAVVIATPAENHFDLVKQALLAGKDVFVEKPICLSIEGGQELVDLAAKRHRILMVGHLLWYHPAVLKLKQLIEEGELGRVQYIYSNRLNLGKIRREENILWSFAPHDISVILGLLGEMPQTVTAQGGNYLHQDIADVTVSLLTFPSGVRAHIFVSWLHPFKEQKLVVVGDRKMAVFDDTEKKDKLLLYPHSINWKNNIPVPTRAEAQPVSIELGEPLKAECLHFLECVRTRRNPRTDGREGVKVLEVIQQCEESLEAPSVKTQRSLSLNGKNDDRFFAHESAFIDDGVQIEEGVKIWHASHILKGSRIGKHSKIGQNVVIGPHVVIGQGVKIQNNVSVYEGVTLEDYVFCGPSMVFTNVFNPRSEIPRMSQLQPTLVRQGATLGGNCTILCGTTIGRYAFIGAGAVILEDVPDYALVVGNPGKQIGWMCRCGNKLLKEEATRWTCASCQEQYYETTDGGLQEEKAGLPWRHS